MILMRVSNQKITISYKVRVKLTSKVKHPCEDKSTKQISSAWLEHRYWWLC